MLRRPSQFALISAAAILSVSTLMIPGFAQASGEWANAVPATFAAGVQYSAPYSHFNSVSCSSAGNCTAAGEFSDLAGNYEAFTQSETGGVGATAVPATFAAGVQNTTAYSYFNSVSCSSAGNCTAAGEFRDSAGNYEAFTQSSLNGATVSFNANGGSGSMSGESSSSPTALSANTFTRSGYTFAGWATSPSGPVAYADAATYPFTSSVTLYAVWVLADVPASPPIALSVTGGHGSLSAIFEAPSEGATSYSCSLLIGSTLVRTTTNTPYLYNTNYGCSFTGLKGNSLYGVSVTAYNQFGPSPPVTEWARTLAAPVTRSWIICVNKKHDHRRVTGVHPTCPAGFHRV